MQITADKFKTPTPSQSLNLQLIDSLFNPKLQYVSPYLKLEPRIPDHYRRIKSCNCLSHNTSQSLPDAEETVQINIEESDF